MLSIGYETYISKIPTPDAVKIMKIFYLLPDEPDTSSSWCRGPSTSSRPQLDRQADRVLVARVSGSGDSGLGLFQVDLRGVFGMCFLPGSRKPAATDYQNSLRFWLRATHRLPCLHARRSQLAVPGPTAGLLFGPRDAQSDLCQRALAVLPVNQRNQIDEWQPRPEIETFSQKVPTFS